MNFLRELKYTAISMVSTVEGMFWTVAYPIILSSLFFVIFSAINTRGISTAVNTGITETNPHRVIFNFIPIVHVIPMEQEAADAALREQYRFSGQRAAGDGDVRDFFVLRLRDAAL